MSRRQDADKLIRRSAVFFDTARKPAQIPTGVPLHTTYTFAVHMSLKKSTGELTAAFSHTESKARTLTYRINGGEPMNWKVEKSTLLLFFEAILWSLGLRDDDKNDGDGRLDPLTAPFSVLVDKPAELAQLLQPYKSKNSNNNDDADELQYHVKECMLLTCNKKDREALLQLYK